MLSNNKFLGKCWYGRQPWIRLAMDCERMVEKGINFILCLGTANDVSSMESIENYFVVFVKKRIFFQGWYKTTLAPHIQNLKTIQKPYHH